MTIQIELEWEKDNLTETLLHLVAAQPPVWMDRIDQPEPSIDVFENLLFSRLKQFFEQKNRSNEILKEPSSVETLLRPVWLSYVLSENVILDGGDMVFSSLRQHGYLELIESGSRSTRLITLESNISRLIVAKIVFLTCL